MGVGERVSVEAMALVLHHSRAKGTAKLILIGIANHDGDGGSWPSIATLAKYANVNESTVRRALRELEELDEIRVHLNAGGTHETRGDRRPNRYDLLIACPQTCDRTTKHGGASTHAGRSEQGRVDASTGSAPTHERGRVDAPLTVPQPPREPEPLSSPDGDGDESQLVLVSDNAAALGDPFERWYALYPKKVGRKDARKAYHRALREASPEELLAGLRLYLAADPHREMQYTPAPAVWLNKGRWADDPGALIPARPSRGAPGSIDANVAAGLALAAELAAEEHPCCDTHLPGPTRPNGMGWCCDVNDCGPCCPDCPSCPTLQRDRAAGRELPGRAL